MRKTLMLAASLALLAGPALAAGKSPQTNSNTPDPAASSATGQPGNMDAGQASPSRSRNLSQAPDKSKRGTSKDSPSRMSEPNGHGNPGGAGGGTTGH